MDAANPGDGDYKGLFCRTIGTRLAPCYNPRQPCITRLDENCPKICFKLMNFMVVQEMAQSLYEFVSVSIVDLDLLKGSHSRLRLGTELSRRDMLRIALMASENRAASSLARHYPGGTDAFVQAMNQKAQS